MTYLTQSHHPHRHLRRHVGLSTLFSVYRQRRALARLDDAALRDIGKTRKEAQKEANRPFWDVFVE